MNVVLFYHSLLSDWNHGNAHFLRGVASELARRGHDVRVYEPFDAWSVRNLVRDHGDAPLHELWEVYPGLTSVRYALDELDLDRVLVDADLVLMHEWNERALVRRVGAHRARTSGYRLLFHDTHHRALTDQDGLAWGELGNYDGVLAFGEVLRQRYLQRGWARRVWTWHEAADVEVFRPPPGGPGAGGPAGGAGGRGGAWEGDADPGGDLVWIGNWGDGERSAELHEFLLDPVRDLGLAASAYGVRYPDDAVEALDARGIRYRGWLPNYRVPEVFARYRMTVHVPRRPYVRALPGIPTIRPFEALACGIPLVTSPWDDREGLFRAGEDYLLARDGDEMRAHLRALANDDELRRTLAENGRATILERHTCAHRVDELLAIERALRGQDTAAAVLS